MDPEELRLLDAWWRAANYLSVGQIYLMGNPLIRRPLVPEDVKPRLLGGSALSGRQWLVGCTTIAPRASPRSGKRDAPAGCHV